MVRLPRSHRPTRRCRLPRRRHRSTRLRHVRQTPTGYDLRHAAGELSSVIAALGHDDALLVGSDTGASIAWAIASMYPERVRGLISLGAIHPLDMRRAIRRKPHLHVSDLSRLAPFRLPSFLHNLFHFGITSEARREIVNNTSSSYQRSNAFTETVLLRKKHYRSTTPSPRSSAPTATSLGRSPAKQSPHRCGCSEPTLDAGNI